MLYIRTIAPSVPSNIIYSRPLVSQTYEGLDKKLILISIAVGLDRLILLSLLVQPYDFDFTWYRYAKFLLKLPRSIIHVQPEVKKIISLIRNRR